MESRKRIVVNDESDDERSAQQELNAFAKFALPQEPPAHMDEEWLDTRHPSSMTTSEKQENITSARLERKSMAILTPKPQSMSLLSPGLEDTPENAAKAHQHSRLRRLEKTNDNGTEAPAEQQKKPAKKKLRRSIEEVDEESFDDSDVTEESDDEESIGDSSDADAGANIESDGEGQEYDDENEQQRGQQELKDMAAKILKKCDKTIASLRDALRIWAGRSISGGDDNADNADADCVNLLSIEGETGDHRILKDQDFTVMCPSLELKPYQLVGVNWLKLLHQNGVNGVLADDMGLGKTVQTIAFLGWLRGKANRRTSLIVVPATTLSNWCNELEKFCPNLRVTVYHGSQKERDMMRYPLHTSIEAREVDVVLSTYTIFERESCKEDQSFLRKQRFDYLILDEAHCIKNSTSSRYQKLNVLNSKHRLLLSGTPVQNDIKELLALLSFLMPKIFSRKDCAVLVEAFGLESADAKDKYKSLLAADSSSTGLITLGNLRSMLAPFVLRRLKSNVLDQLSPKETFVMKVEMNPFQLKVYENIIRSHALRKNMKSTDDNYANLEALEKKRKAADIDSTTTEPVPDTASAEEADDAYAAVIRDLSPNEAKNIFTALRKAANHPLLLRVRYVEEETLNLIATVALSMGHFGKHCDKLDRIREEIEKFSDYDIHRLCLEYPQHLGHLRLDASTLYDSPKLALMKELLPKLRAEGHRMLIFSQWTRLLDLLEVFLLDMGMRYLRLDGSTPIKDRQIMIDEFSLQAPAGELHPIPVFLLSTKAGGLGINLIAADTVILHDLDFNPENDRQAEDRCHRIGQTKPVKVYKLVSGETVDEDIFDMGERKSRLTEAVLSEKHGVTGGDDDEGDEKKTKGGKGKKKAADDDDDLGDIGSIGRILQKALQRLNR